MEDVEGRNGLVVKEPDMVLQGHTQSTIVGPGGVWSMNSILEKVSALTRQRCVEAGYDLGKVEELARNYLDVWKQQGYVGLTCREALEAPDYLWISFFTGLKDRDGVADRPSSPVAHWQSSDWMRDYDYTFFNVRATSLVPQETGSFLQGIKLLPILRTKGLHMAPFMDCNFGNVYCIDSLEMVYRQSLDEDMLAMGITADEQVRFFIDLAHMAGFVVGFDLEPHTSQFSRVVLQNPEMFRWVQLNKAKSATVPKGMKTLLKEKHQEKIRQQVRDVVAKACKKAGLESLEDPNGDFEVIQKTHTEALTTLINNGIWTLPSHTWGGVGLPEFTKYNKKDNYPEFDYRNEEGEDHAEHAFGMLTPFRFYDNLPINKLPTEKDPPVINEDVVEFFASIFPKVQDKYGFDYVRLDYVDHVFDSIMEGDEEKNVEKQRPISDRCIPSVLKRVIDKARSERPYTGAMAERMGMDVTDYGSIGFDVMLGCDILGPIHPEAISGTLAFTHEAAEFAQQYPRIATVPWSVDTHDSGNPLFWTKPISEVIGSSGMLLRQFVSRFATPGPVRRPKYECMGNLDMSHGLFKANNEDVSIEWVGDRNHTRIYHAIEDVYNRFNKMIREGWASWWTPEDQYCAWCIDTHQGPDGWRGRLICVVALERKYKNLKEAAADQEPLPVVPSIELDVNKDWDRPVKEVYEVLLDGSNFERPMPLVHGHRIRTGGLAPRSFRMYLVRG